MRRDSLFFKIGLIIFGAIVLLLAFIFVIERPRTTTNQFSFPVITVTPIPLNFNKQSYSDSNQSFKIEYPQSWTRESVDLGNTATFTFKENATSYKFEINPPVGNTLPDMFIIGADKVENNLVYYGGKQFIRKLYLRQGQPILIFVMPNQDNFSFYSFSMELPPTNTQKYISLFDQILVNMQINKSFDPNQLLNPSPTNNP